MQYKVILLIFTLFVSNFINSEPMIILFVRAYPAFFFQEHAQRLSKSVAKPGSIARKKFHLVAQKDFSVAGLLALYGGFFTFSDPSGLIMFPLLHAASSITIAVTPKVTPIVMIQNTIHHWEVEDDTPIALYTITHTKDPLTHIAFVTVESIPIPADKILKPEVLILLDNPSNVYIPLGASIAEDSPHFLVPDVYIKKSPSPTVPLYLLPINHYFGTFTPQYKQLTTEYLRNLVP